nr:TolC family protein [Iningainema tapete]
MTTQPSLADTAKVNEVRYFASPQGLSAIYDLNSAVKKVNPQQLTPYIDSFPAIFTPISVITNVNPVGSGGATVQEFTATGVQGSRGEFQSIPPTPLPNSGKKRVAQTGSPKPNAPINNAVPTKNDQPPSYLNPNPNPLQFPTKPDEVTVQGTQPITLAQALELARRNNRELQVALLTLERNRFALREAQASLLPSANLSSDLTRSGPGFSDQILPGSNPLDPTFRSSSTGFNASAQINYQIYTSGQRNANIRANEEQVRSSELDVERQSEEIRLNVTTQYYDLQQADEQVRINEAAVRNAQASLRDAQALERAGVGTRFAVLQSQVNLADAQQNLTNAISQQRITRRRLVTSLSLSQSVDISAADPVQLAGLWNQTLENSIVLAFQNRPELQQQLANRNINEQRRRLALAQLGPQISLVAGYSLQDTFDDSGSIIDNYSLGVRANLTLFDGGAARASANQRRADIRIAETQFAETRNQIRFQVEQAYSNLQSNLENIQTATAALDQARESLRLARLRFQAGVGTQTDVIDAENRLTQAEGRRVSAILDYNRALASLQRSVTSRAFLR